MNLSAVLSPLARARTAALAAAAALPDPDPVSSISYDSTGRTLMIGAAADVAPWAQGLSALLPLTVLITDAAEDEDGAAARLYPVHRVQRVHLDGYLGAFEAVWDAHGDVGRGSYDVVLDLSDTALIARHEKPPGYFAPGADIGKRADAVRELADMIGEFEKPKYFTYKERLCAHSRNKLIGCNACIEICSAEAISGRGDKIVVNPNLCAGCGACGTVCPTGALSYNYPSAAYTGERLRALIGAYRAAGGGAPSLLFHSGKHGKALIADLEAGAGGVPAHQVPIEIEHTASVGIDVWLAAFAYGAGAIDVLMTDEEAPQYRGAIGAQMEIANTVLAGLGWPALQCRLIEASASASLALALERAPVAIAPFDGAGFHVMADKRNTLDLALTHLALHAPVKAELIALPPASPFGNVRVDTGKCSLCMACVGACPSSALMDSTTVPQLRFVEKNCVQCGLCETTCPESAIVLEPRLSLLDTWNKPVVKHESTPFCCIRCAKPFGSLQMITNMIAKMGGHAAFAGHLDRLRMCGDCRVIDMMKSGDSARVTGRAPG
ncbi:4Fe-4S binding protein [Massilia sp. DWR3-1-1]|uniref:4Fe-4S binding protein n=1 Tax=Massilia sp. DWR3-1-1 TaxID=2804559 RepID=UPI003CF2A073